jgi:hypothetical protein
MKKTALIFFTGDRIEFLDYSIKSCLNFLEKGKIQTIIDIYLISFFDNIKTKHNINYLKINKPCTNKVNNFPYTKQIELQKNKTRLNYGIYLLFDTVPNCIFNNIEKLSKYDYILKCRSDLVFDTNNFHFEEDKLYTFECLWGDLRYYSKFTNDQFIFGNSKEVLKIVAYPENSSNLSNFWNPEEYTSHLFSKSNFTKIYLTTKKYYLISKERKVRKFVGHSEKLNESDIEYLKSIGMKPEDIINPDPSSDPFL